MNEHLSTSGAAPYSREGVQYTSLADFREDETVFLVDESFPYEKISPKTEYEVPFLWLSAHFMKPRFNLFDAKGLIKSNLTMEEMRLYMTQHKQSGPFTSRLVSNPLDPKIVIKSFWPGSNYFKDRPCVDLAVKGCTIDGYKFPFTVWIIGDQEEAKVDAFACGECEFGS